MSSSVKGKPLDRDVVKSELLSSPQVSTQKAPIGKQLGLSKEQLEMVSAEVARQVALLQSVPLTTAQQAMTMPVGPAFDPKAPRIEFTLKDPKTGGWYMRKVSDPMDPILDKIELLGWRVSFVIPNNCSIRMDIKRARAKLAEGVL